MSAQDLLLTALNQRAEKYLAEKKRCKEEFSEAAVHDLRVAARRLLALVEMLRCVAPAQMHPRLQKLRQGLKDQLDRLDDLRDTQVLLAEISATLETLPELAPLQKFLQKREKRLLKTAEQEESVCKSGGVSRRIEKIRAGLTELAPDPDLTAQLFAAVDDASLTVSQRQGRVDPARPVTIHRVRVAFKKFRYLIEILCPALPGFPEAQFARMHAYQEAMGRIQDVEVLLRTLAGFADKDETYDPLPVRRFYELRHAELINACLENLNGMAAFWRETPDQAFPWEAQAKGNN
jgi:CHAD domain-containing protein